MVDPRGRIRRIYAKLDYFWFVWGDRHGERALLFRVLEAAAVIARHALVAGWLSGPQGDLEVDMPGRGWR